MARRRSYKKFHRSKSFTLPIAPIVGLAVGLGGPLNMAIAGNIDGAIEQLGLNYTGYSMHAKNWDAMRMQNGLLPLVIGGLVHKFVGGKLGINKMLASAGVPIIRI